MSAWLRHVLNAAFLYAQNAQPSDTWGTAQIAWALAAAGALAAGWLWRRRARARRVTHNAPWVLMGLSVATLIALVLQRHTAGVFSARIWALMASLLAAAMAPLAWLLRRRPPAWLTPIAHGLALRLTPEDPAPMRGWVWAWICLHGVGLAWCALQAPWGWLAALLAAIALGATWLAQRRVRWEVWAPLLLLYAAVALQTAVHRFLAVDTAPYAAFPYPDLWSPWFDLPTVALAACGWMLLSATSAWQPRHRARWGHVALGLGLIWYLAVVLRHLSHGAGGSDPFCYLQMAADLATRGGAQHLFPLSAIVARAGASLWPVAHMGYHPPLAGQAATVWPPGWPALLAPWIALGGEGLALRAAPLALVCGAALTWGLARMLGLAGWARVLAALLVLSSYEAVLRSLVPMADAAALALGGGLCLALMRARQRDALGWSLVAGLLWGLVYDVRHPQIWLGLAAVPILWGARWGWHRKVLHLGLFAGAGLLAAAPDLVYHTRTFGAPWVTESREWFLLSWRNVPRMIPALLRDGWLRRNEFGYLWPWIGLGLGAALRPGGKYWAWIALAVGAAAVLLFHLCYSALRWRDLIPLAPFLALWAARGAQATWTWAQTRRAAPNAARMAVVASLALALAVRGAQTLALPLAAEVSVFGHITTEQRAAFASLGECLPPDAVVATGLSSGAVERYAGHLTVRPSSWAAAEFARVADELARAGWQLYILDDGEEMEQWLARPGLGLVLQPAGDFAIPTFGLGGQDYHRPAHLYRLKP